MKPDYTLDNVKETLDNIILTTSPDCVFFHFSLGVFGFFDFSPLELIESIVELRGRTTLVIPTYNYDFFNGIEYSHEESLSQVGLLTEIARNHPQFIRTRNVVYSHAVAGIRENFLLKASSKTAFGDGSFFDLLTKMDTYIIFWGANWNSMTFFHYLEEVASVPYRYNKTFHGAANFDGRVSNKSIDVYSRNLEINPRLNLNVLRKEIEGSDLLHSFPLGRGSVEVVKLSDLADRALKSLSSDYYHYVNINPSC